MLISVSLLLKVVMNIFYFHFIQTEHKPKLCILFSEYLRHRNCFDNSELHDEGEICNATLSIGLSKLDKDQSKEYKIKRICQ